MKGETDIDARPDIDARMRAGLQAQAEARRRALAEGAKRLGWKAGYGSRAAISQLGTSGPLAGYLTDRTSIAPGGEADLAGWRKPALEAEVAVRIDRDVSAGVDPDAAAAAIGAVAAAIELVDLDPSGDLEQELAMNIFHRHVVLGAFQAVDDPAELRELRVDVLRDGGAVETQVDPEALLGDLTQVVRAVADLLPVAGDRLRDGDILITGSVIVPVALEGGERYEVRLGGSQADVKLGA
jgi:2-keto-4-pentenoate hydratase